MWNPHQRTSITHGDDRSQNTYYRTDGTSRNRGGHVSQSELVEVLEVLRKFKR